MQKQAQHPTKGKEQKGPLVQIKLGSGKATDGARGAEIGGIKKSGFKKGGFKSAFGSVDEEEEVDVKEKEEEIFGIGEQKAKVAEDEDSDFTEEENYYDPRQPTGCMPGCRGRSGTAVG